MSEGRTAALAAAAVAYAYNRPDPDPLHALLPGTGREPADPDDVDAVTQVIGHDPRLRLNDGSIAQPNVALLRAALRRWGMQVIRHVPV